MKQFLNNFNEEKLKEALRIKEAYIKGEIPLDLANAQMKAHVGSLTPMELAYVEQQFAELVELNDINEEDLNIPAIYEGLIINDELSLLNGHPIKNYFDENNQIRKVLADIDLLFTKTYIKNQWDEAFEKLNTFKNHLSRKQNQLYPSLEKKGFDRPTATMWLFDNEVKDSLSRLSDFCKSEFKYENIKPVYDDFKALIFDLMEKEETVLYKVALEMISEKEFYEMISGDKEIGYSLINPSDDFAKSIDKKFLNEAKANEASSNPSFEEELKALMSKHNISSWTPKTPMNVSTGLLSLEQINLIFKHMPVDISYVDENELVAFYTDTKHRVFPRSKGVIGRDVKNCHPASSVHIVEEIIEKFRAGIEDKAEFWINKGDIFIYILYVAVRDEKGNFKGVMEMMQDATHIRALEGSQTLLTWDSERETYKATRYKYDNPGMGPKYDREEAENEASENLDTSNNDNNNLSSSDKITVLTEDLKLETLLKQYPTLKDYMVSKSDKFAMMNSPMFKVLGKIATVKIVSERTGISIDRLQKEFDIYLKNL